MKRPADNAHRALAETDLDTTYLVEAAAGTGKTTLLVSRIMTAIKTERASLSQICAITFTEKAAGELKVRLRRTIEKELRNGGPGDILRAALNDLDAMSVTTIHSFCADLIRERPVEAGVDPGFSPADELASSLLFDQTWSDWLAEVLSGENPALRRCVEAGLSFASKSPYTKDASALARALAENRDLLPNMTTAPKWTEEQFQERVGEILTCIESLTATAETDCPAKSEDRGYAQIRALAQWRETAPTKGTKNLQNWLERSPKVSATAGTKKNWSPSETLAETKRLFASLKVDIEEIKRAFSHNILVDLFEALKEFVERFDHAKTEARVLDFQDLLLRARDMLRDSRAAREHLKAQYRFVLVDEFQDTDPLQTEIVFFLAEKRGTFAREWDAVTLAPGKLFLVGDPKQSIYGFRRADLDLYGRVREVIEKHGQTLNLNVNFRTVPEIIEEVNSVFASLMEGPVNGRYEPMHAPMAPYRSPLSDGPKLLDLRPPEGMPLEDIKAEERRRLEAGAIAACIARMAAEKTPVYDHDIDAVRPFQYSDAAVLFRATTGIEQLEEALRAHDVPYQISGGKHYYARLEFQDLLNVLRAIANPFDGLSIVGALRSPFFGASDTDILTHFATCGNFNYLHDIPSESARLSDAFETLKHLHECRATHSIPIVITDLFERTQALQIYAMKPHGEQRVANLLKLRDMARSLSAQGISSFPAFVRWISRMEDTSQTESESLIAEADDNFVQLMTFHKAKGLEFPVVLLADLGARDSDRENFIIGRTTTQLDVNLSGNLQTLEWDEAFSEVKDRAEHERRRLLYVAMTRARDMLILPMGWSAKREGYLKYLPENEGNHDTPDFLCVSEKEVQKQRRDDFRLKPPKHEEMTEAANQYWKHRTDWKAELADRTARMNSARRIRTATEKTEQDDYEPRPLPHRSPDSEAAALGNLVHRLLETADLRAPASDLSERAKREAAALDLGEHHAQEATDLVRRTLDLPIIRERAAVAHEVFREVPFTVNYDGELLEGRVDALFIEPEGAVILDYKTDRVTAEEAVAGIERYRPQAQVYRDAMTAALGMPVKEVVFIFCRRGVAVSLGALTHTKEG